MNASDHDLVDPVLALAREAGHAALEHYGLDEPVEKKADDSPLTRADRAAHEILARGLARLVPSLPVLSEESSTTEIAERRSWPRFWLVDPLDGTKEFLKRTGEFTVNIALVAGDRPVLGVVYLPVSGLAYVGSSRGAFRVRGDGRIEPIRTRPLVEGRLVVVASKDHGGPELEKLLARLPGAERVAAGSALKLGRVAEGAADLYPRTGRTMEWDTAAGQCVVEAAGGRVTDFAGRPLVYNKESLENPWFLAWGDASVDWSARLR